MNGRLMQVAGQSGSVQSREEKVGTRLLKLPLGYEVLVISSKELPFTEPSRRVGEHEVQSCHTSCH